MQNRIVADVMTREPVIVKPDINLLDCAKKMVRKRVGSLLLVEKKKLVGLIKKKILSKKNKVNYDDGKGRIISIPDLVYQNGKYFIDL